MEGDLLVAEKLGPTAETVRKWVRRAEIDGGVRPSVTTAEAELIRRLGREVRELRWSSRRQLAQAIFEWIEVFYNAQHRHSTLGMLAPLTYATATEPVPAA